MPKTKSKQNNTIVVLAQKRSGTSLISGVLHKLGVPMGKQEELEKSSDRNEWGFWEDLAIVQVSKEVIELVKKKPHLSFARLELEFEDRIKTLVEERNKQGTWGFKDPNQPQTHRLFRKHLRNPKYVVVFRNPLDIAISILDWRSTHQKVDIPIITGVERVLDVYSTLLETLKTIQDDPMMFMSYERTKQDPEKHIKNLIKFLEINPSEKQIKEAIAHVK